MENFDDLCLNSGHLRKISIPSTGFVETYVVYHIEVSLYGYSWTVKRRYREFFELHEKLTKQFPTLQKKLTLPPKKLLRNFDPLHVEKRRQSLEAYLQNIVTELGKIPRVLQTFLEFHIYDVLAVTQTLAEELFITGDSILANEEIFEVTPLQLYCISKRLKLPMPTCGGEDYGYDVGNLYDIVYCVQSVKIVEDDRHSVNNFSEEDISYDLSLFKNLKILQISKCNIESLQGTFHLQENLQKLSVHNSLHLLKDILIDQDVWSHDAGEEVLKQGGSVIMTWKHLTEIDFSHNDIPYIDESVTLLHELIRLDLSYNKIQQIDHLQDLPNLRELNLSFNQIESLKFVNTKLGNIASLRLAGNRLRKVGDLSKMFSLVNLDLSENSIDDITDVISLAHLPCLENLILLANPVRHQATFRIQLLAAFEDRVSQICLDRLIPTRAEIKNVMQIIAEESRYEVVDLPHSSALSSPRKNKTGHKRAFGRRIKIATRDVLEDAKMKASSVPASETTEDDQKFRERVDRIRRLGGDGWLGLLNEVQNENKEGVEHTSASLPGNMASAVQNSQKVTSSRNINERQNRSDLKFGFSAELEKLVNLTMKKDKDVLTGPFIVSVEGDGGDEERMVDLRKEVIMEIIIDSNKISRKYNLDEISSVDILESSGSWYVDLLHTEHKEFRRHSDFYANNDDSTGKFRHLAKYRMRSMKDAAELFVLLYKIVSDSLSRRSSQRSYSDLSQTSQQSIANDVSTIYSNPIGLTPDVFHQFLNKKFGCPMESELTESARHTTETGNECAHFILWASCLPYALPDHELPVCLVLTSANVYLFNLVKVASLPRKVEQLEKILPLVCRAPLSDLCGVVRGVFDLTFRLEFSKRGQYGTFAFLTRDSEMTESFMKVLEESTASDGDVKPSYEIVNTSELRLEKLKREIAMSCGKIFKDDERVLVYAVVREVTSTEVTSAEVTLTKVTSSDHVISKPGETTSSTSSHVTSTTRSLVLTNWNLFLCEEDHLHWPLPSYVRDAPSTPQWVVTKHDDVKHIIGIEVYDVTGECAFVGTSGMCLLLENPASRGTEVWNVVFKLKEEREQFQRSLSQIWSYNFHGELQATKTKPICAKNIHHSPRVDVAAHFFQEGLMSSGIDDSQNRKGKGHRRNASGQFYPVLNEDSVRTSMEVLHNANTGVLERFFNETLRHKCGNDRSETLVSYAWTGCVAYTHPTREIHVWLVLSSSKVYIVADLQDRGIIGDALEVLFGTGTKLCFNWLPLATLRQVCVGFFDQTFRLETDDPENTFTFITRDYQVTSCFLENLQSTLKEIGAELPVPRASSDHSPSIYDTYLSSSEVDNEHSTEDKFHHSKGAVKFVYPNDDMVEILKHSVLEYAIESEYFTSLDDISILLYLLMFQIIDGRKLSRTFMVLSHTLCTCVENHVNFPLPLFVKGLPVGSRYEIERLRLITDIKRIEFSGFNTQDFTIVYKKERLRSKVEDVEGTGESDVGKNGACREGEERWAMIAQTYEEKEKALGIILKFWKENVGEDLPVLKL